VINPDFEENEEVPNVVYGALTIKKLVVGISWDALPHCSAVVMGV